MLNDFFEEIDYTMRDIASIPANYWQKFPDISFASWKIQGESSWALSTPNKAIVTFNPDLPNFDDPQIVENVSTKMWIYSLGFLSKIECQDIIQAILVTFINRFEGTEELYKISSWDHCAAVRISSMLHIVSRFGGTGASECALTILREAVQKVEDRYLAKNNHGMMLAFSGVQAASLGTLEEPECSRVLNQSFCFLRSFLANTFDDQGWCNENTPGYQDFFRKYLASAVSFLDEFGEDDALKSLMNSAHQKVEEALYKVVLPNGNIPPIGESGAYPTRFPSVSGTHFFEESGFFVTKSDSTYFSVISGRRSETHKQMDDTAICLWSSGDYLLLDSGLYTYNTNDIQSRALNSQRGHSGFFLKQFDHFRRAEFVKKFPNYSANIRRAKLEGLDTIQCSCAVPELDLSWSRRVTLNSPWSLSLLDLAGRNISNDDLVQRFIIPNEAEVVCDGNTFLITNGAASLSMVVHGKFRHSFKTAKLGSEAIGWRSKAFGQIEPAQAIEIYPAGLESKIDLVMSHS
ncbi:MAG: heparinase II/III domain-containing protein [Sulfitobacter sp.]